MGWFLKRETIGAILLLLSGLGCVKYSFRGALPSDIQTIAIPLFEDRSAWVGLQEQLTRDVIDAFIRDNTLQVIESEKDADLLLKGTILSVQRRRTAITAQEVVEEERLVVNVKVECINQHTGKPLWSGNVTEFGVLSGTGSVEENDLAIAEAVEKIVESIVNRTVAAW